MSYRDTLPAGTRARFDAAVTSAAIAFAAAVRDRDDLAATQGTRAVAEAAWYPGHALGSVQAIQARYEELHGADRGERAA